MHASIMFCSSASMEAEAKCSTLGQVWELYDLRKARNMPRVNSLMLLTGALIAFVAAISCFAPRYRHHPIVGLFFLAANTLFLPIISLVTGTLGEDDLFPTEVKNAAWDCKTSSNMLLVMMWTGLVLDIIISTSTMVAGTAREANVDLPISLASKPCGLRMLWCLTCHSESL